SRLWSTSVEVSGTRSLRRVIAAKSVLHQGATYVSCPAAIQGGGRGGDHDQACSSHSCGGCGSSDRRGAEWQGCPLLQRIAAAVRAVRRPEPLLRLLEQRVRERRG